MTAVVGILNKQAVAIAADSAVTIGGANGRKILNKANKVFTLSKRHPVGVMIYNSATFMHTPWETIIKIYREQLGDKSFPKIADYQTNFIEFLREKSFFTDEQTQLNSLQNLISNIINIALNDIIKENGPFIKDASKEQKQLYTYLFNLKIEHFINFWSKQTERCEEFDNYEFESFRDYSAKLFNSISASDLNKIGIELIDDKLIELEKAVYYILIAKEEHTSYTGLIFTGFGEEEIYPSLMAINISMVIDNRLRFHINQSNCASISNENNGAVCPFAQTDVIDTLLSGIDPSLDDIYLKNFDALLKKYNDAILDSIGNTNPLLSEQIKNLDTQIIVNEFNNLNQEIKIKNYITPLMDAVSSLDKVDLAEMAESLIYLTYLKRRITFAEESVGGPVDVAVISKGDGFIWIKRKHYFQPELNTHFFNNYFKQ